MCLPFKFNDAAKECLSPPDVYVKYVLPLLNAGKVVKFSCVHQDLRSAAESLLVKPLPGDQGDAGQRNGHHGVNGDNRGTTGQSHDLTVELYADKWLMSDAFGWMLDQVS